MYLFVQKASNEKTLPTSEPVTPTHRHPLSAACTFEMPHSEVTASPHARLTHTFPQLQSVSPLYELAIISPGLPRLTFRFFLVFCC